VIFGCFNIYCSTVLEQNLTKCMVKNVTNGLGEVSLLQTNNYNIM